ncbi:MAG: cellulase family glycosylhydrolase [Verrucomicrobiota bacterium]
MKTCPLHLLALCVVVTFLIGRVAEAQPALTDPVGKFLRADGTVLRDGKGSAIQLRGVNLGGWLKWESWMCPIDISKTLRDGNPGHNGYDFEARRLLVKRFGAKTAGELIATYEDVWITAADLDRIKALGMNVVRVPFAYSTVLNEDGAWRSDAFTRLDWVVREAWRRGLYTILDFHAFLPPSADHDGSAGGYFASTAQKAETVRIWKRIAEHYRGNPAIAMYDLLNEPNNSNPKGKPAPKSQVVCDLYDDLYKAIRSVDPDHLIAMEGMWDWKTLRDPVKSGYKNAVYSFHWYNWSGKTTADRNQATDNDLSAVAEMQKAWNVPVFVGEFNLFGDRAAWKYAFEKYDQYKLNWTMWTFKNTASGDNSWGVYTTIPRKAPPVPNLMTDSADVIRQKWQAWRTSPEAFALNPMFKLLLGSTSSIPR